jgi:hypothetical protein
MLDYYRVAAQLVDSRVVFSSIEKESERERRGLTFLSGANLLMKCKCRYTGSITFE